MVHLPPDTEPQHPDAAVVSPPGGRSVPSPSPSQLLFKLDCNLEEVNVFTLSNLAGKGCWNITLWFKGTNDVCLSFSFFYFTKHTATVKVFLFFFRRSGVFANGLFQSVEFSRKLPSVSAWFELVSG